MKKNACSKSNGLFKGLVENFLHVGHHVQLHVGHFLLFCFVVGWPPCRQPCRPPCRSTCRPSCQPPCWPPCQPWCQPPCRSLQCRPDALWGLIDADRMEIPKVWRTDILKEDPFALRPPTFGHWPNRIWPTHPHSTGHSGAGPGWAPWDQFEKICKITVVAVNKCPKPSGQASV